MKRFTPIALFFVLAAGACFGADEPAAAKDNIRRPGTYTSGKWTYKLAHERIGNQTEKSEGTISYDGKVLDLRPQTNDYVRTPWGPLYWVGKHTFTWGPRGWMPDPAEGEKRIGRELSVDGVPVEEAKALPFVAGTAQEIVLQKEACGDYVEAMVGQFVTIKLPGNPSTGYEWTALPPDHGSLVQVGSAEFHQDAAPEGKVGTGGMYVFHFRADQVGAAKITLLYKRNWEKEAAERFTVMVRVSPNEAAR